MCELTAFFSLTNGPNFPEREIVSMDPRFGNCITDYKESDPWFAFNFDGRSSATKVSVEDCLPV